MPRYKSKYKEDWENEIDASGEKIKKWVRKISDKIAKCDLCNKEIKLESLGLTALLRHALQKKHQNNVESSNNNSSNPSTSVSSSNSRNSDPSTSVISNPSTSTSVQLTEISSEDSATITEKIANAEAMWSAMVVEHGQEAV